MSEAMKCPTCNGYNVSLDMETGLVNCHDCPVREPSKPKLFDVDAWKEDQIEKEEEAINKMIGQGNEVKIRDNEKDFNDFSKLGV